MCREFRKGRRDTALRDGLKLRPVERPERAKSDVAQPHRLFQQRVEHRRVVAGGEIDHLQYLGGRGLLLQCLACLGQQARVLHRNDRLRCEVFEQRDFLLDKRPDLMSRGGDHA